MSTININVSKVDMGLDQVDNTSDLNKPISTATQTALDNIDLQSVTDLGNTTTDNIAFTGAVGVLFDNTSTLRKGTIDAGYGGAKGIAQVCAVGYELKWEAGRLYVMGDGGTTIREVSHNFTTTPSATDDNTKGFIVGSRWILDNGDLYVCTDVTTATAVWVLQTIDASPTDGSTKAVSSNGVFDALALKQDILSGGTTNRLTKWSSSSAIGVSLIQDNGTTLSIGTTPVANNLIKVSSNSTDVTLVSENSQSTGVGISGTSSGANGVGGSFTSTSVTGVKVGVNASATGAGGTNKGAVFGATGGATNYSIQLTDGTEGSGKFLKSVTANGEANWASISNTDVSGLGTLATQSGTFSGTSSGTNTGDQIISDATITTTDITTNNFTTAKHGFVPKGTNVGNYLKDDGTWSAISAGGLTYFTEAQSTASPNNTVNVDSLTAVASTTNADFAIRPKGTGSILARVPDNTGTGGAKRGQYALDLSRTAGAGSNYIAAGDYDIILGGTRNISSTGTFSFIANGDYNSCTGTYGTILNGNSNSVTGARGIVLNGSYSQANGANSIAGGGAYNYANGSSSVALCNGTTASAVGSMAVNQGAVASGQNSFAGGNGSTANGINSFVVGDLGSANSIRNKFAIGGSGWAINATQAGIVQLDARTTSTTPTVMEANTANSAGVSAATQFTLPNNSLMRVKGTIQGKQSGSTNVGVWDFDAVLVRGTTASTMTVTTSNVNVVTNIQTWGTPTITANTTLGCMTVTVTGIAATNIQWACRIDSTETLYA